MVDDLIIQNELRMAALQIEDGSIQQLIESMNELISQRIEYLYNIIRYDLVESKQFQTSENVGVFQPSFRSR